MMYVRLIRATKDREDTAERRYGVHYSSRKYIKNDLLVKKQEKYKEIVFYGYPYITAPAQSPDLNPLKIHGACSREAHERRRENERN